MDVNVPLSLYATLGEVVGDNDDVAPGRTHRTADGTETTDEGRLTVDELLAGNR